LNGEFNHFEVGLGNIRPGWAITDAGAGKRSKEEEYRKKEEMLKSRPHTGQDQQTSRIGAGQRFDYSMQE